MLVPDFWVSKYGLWMMMEGPVVEVVDRRKGFEAVEVW